METTDLWDVRHDTTDDPAAYVASAVAATARLPTVSAMCTFVAANMYFSPTTSCLKLQNERLCGEHFAATICTALRFCSCKTRSKFAICKSNHGCQGWKSALSQKQTEVSRFVNICRCKERTAILSLQTERKFCRRQVDLVAALKLPLIFIAAKLNLWLHWNCLSFLSLQSWFCSYTETASRFCRFKVVGAKCGFAAATHTPAAGYANFAETNIGSCSSRTVAAFASKSKVWLLNCPSWHHHDRAGHDTACVLNCPSWHHHDRAGQNTASVLNCPSWHHHDRAGQDTACVLNCPSWHPNNQAGQDDEVIIIIIIHDWWGVQNTQRVRIECLLTGHVKARCKFSVKKTSFSKQRRNNYFKWKY